MSDRRRAARSALIAFLEAAPDAIVVSDGDGRIVGLNQLTEELFGFKQEELIGQTIELLLPQLHPPDRVTAASERRELAGRRKNGSELTVELSFRSLETEQGRLMISIVRDATHRRKAEAKFRGLLESAPDGIVVVDADGRIVIANTQAERIFGYAHEELIGQLVEVLVPTKYSHTHVAHRTGYFVDPKTRPMGAGRPLTGRKKDGSEFPVEISLSPLETEHGTLVTSIVRDITDRREAEEKLKASLREKEVLLKEIHHRVKNNLQVTSSLLKLQSGYVQDRQAREMFAESQNRIRSLALVHEKLYQSSDLSRIDFSDYLESLTALLFRSFGAASRKIGFKVSGDKVFLAIDTAVPCGLMVNELLSNCLKHAFPEDRPGLIEIRLDAEDGRHFTLSVRDNGVGLPPHIDFNRTETLGLQLVKTLCEQLRAEVEIIRERGTEFRIRFGEPRP